MKVALAQMNYTVGDVPGNADRFEKAVREATSRGAGLCVGTELALTGYPPRDLLFNQGLAASAWSALEILAEQLSDQAPFLIGLPVANTAKVGNPLFNSAAFCRDGKVKGVFHKTLLPTYDVFDEHRYFEPGDKLGVLLVDGMRFGVTICEDIWNDTDFWNEHQRYDRDPLERLARSALDGILNLSASPFTLGKQRIRHEMLASMAKKYTMPFFYANQVGGNDDLVFDGQSMVFDKKGKLRARAGNFQEGILYGDVQECWRGGAGDIPMDKALAEREQMAWEALVAGTRDYVRKCGFGKTLLGLSGGIDSALTAAIAVEALGAENVTGVLMPSPYSSRGSVDDSLALAENLGIRTLNIPIESVMRAFEDALKEPFSGYESDVTEENIQSRIRGNLLMALSNKYGAMLLTTGNKSELSVGYCTIYGDMSGGLAVIADLPKLLVYAVSRWLNQSKGRVVIPVEILEKAPSAELRPDQKDQDSLPPYEVLDPILELLVERHNTIDQVAAQGFERETVVRIKRLVAIAEFKRKQAPPGIKITDRAFGTGWRMPIACRMSL